MSSHSSSSSSSSSSPFNVAQISKASRDNVPPVKEIPGGYDTPLFNAIKDRLDYCYKQGKEELFRYRMCKYDSTIFQVNMPTGPFMASNPKVIVEDSSTLPTFPTSLTRPRLRSETCSTALFMPSFDYFGGYRECAFLDPSEPKHAVLKQFVFSVLVSRHGEIVPLFGNCLLELFVDLEDEIASKGKAYLNTLMSSRAIPYPSAL